MRRRCPDIRRATTLIEVMAGLLVLATLLASAAIARGRFMRLWADSDERLVAARETDELLTRWMAMDPREVPVTATGQLSGIKRHRWQTRVLPASGAAPLGAIVVRLDVFGESASSQPLCQIDFLLRDPRLAVRLPVATLR